MQGPGGALEHKGVVGNTSWVREQAGKKHEERTDCEVVLATWIIRSRKRPLGFHRPSLFRGQVVLSDRFRRGIVLVYQREHWGRDSKPSGKACTSSRKCLSQTSSGMTDELDFRTSALASGCPMVVMVQPAHDRKSDHLVPCIGLVFERMIQVANTGISALVHTLWPLEKLSGNPSKGTKKLRCDRVKAAISPVQPGKKTVL